jgi:hypothetical protein
MTGTRCQRFPIRDVSYDFQGEQQEGSASNWSGRLAETNADCLTSAMAEVSGQGRFPTEFPVQDVSIGALLLQLQATASAPELQPGWVNRRVEQLEFLDTRAVRWQISTDFMVPWGAPAIKRGGEIFRLVPITSLAKINLVAFNLRDENSAAVCMPNSQQTNHYLVAALVCWASQDLKIAPRRLPLALVKDLEWIVSAEPHEFRSKPSALLAAAELIDANRSYRRAVRKFAKLWKELEGIPQWQAWRRYVPWRKVDYFGREVAEAARRRREAEQKGLAVEEHIRPLVYRLMLRPSFRSRIEELAQNFIVHVALSDPPETRRIIKLAYESEVTFASPEGRSRRLWQSLGWRCWQVALLIGGRGGSHHLEVAAPPGVDLVGITADELRAAKPTEPEIWWWRRLYNRMRPVTTKAWWRRLIFWEPNSDIFAPGYLPHVHINPSDGTCIRYQAAIFVRVSRPGWLTASCLVALVLGVVIFAGRLNLPAVYGQGASAEAGTAATLLLALLGVFAVMLAGPGGHPLASRLLFLARCLIVIDTVVVLLASGHLILHRPPQMHHASHGHQAPPPMPVTFWTGLAIAAGVVAILFTMSRLLPVALQPRRE